MILAHAGHWLVSLLYLAPVLAIAIVVGWTKLQDRRRGIQDEVDESSLDEIMDGKR